MVVVALVVVVVVGAAVVLSLGFVFSAAFWVVVVGVVASLPNASTASTFLGSEWVHLSGWAAESGSVQLLEENDHSM